MNYKVIRSADADRDLEMIFDFLFEAAISFGEDLDTAFARASERVLKIEETMWGLGAAPFQGTLLPDINDGLRCVTKDRAIFYFDHVEEENVLRVLAIFFGGQDHRKKFLVRLLSE